MYANTSSRGTPTPWRVSAGNLLRMVRLFGVRGDDRRILPHEEDTKHPRPEMAKNPKSADLGLLVTATMSHF
jgi:hypothetical protein